MSLRGIAVGTVAMMVLCAPAVADQCAWLDAPQVAKLKELEARGFDGGKGLVRFCAPCGDTTATVIPLDPAKTFTATAEDDDFSSITYGTESVDLAYWYVASDAAAPVSGAKSLAALAGCPITDDTPKAVDVAADGTATPAP
jgi:hypothetical protein